MKNRILIACFVFFSTPLVRSQSFIFGEKTLINNPGISIYPYFPDGHISFGKYNEKLYYKVWAGSSSYITLGSSFFNQDSVLGEGLKRGGPTDFDNGGAWLYSVFPIDSNYWLGFYHAEDHLFPGFENPGQIAWKSIARCVSYNRGLTWQKMGQIIATDQVKPNNPTWGGHADFTVVRDSMNNRWVAYFVVPEGIGMAISLDSFARAGTWKKYYNGSFSEPGLNGKASALAFSKDLRKGGNPSVIYSRKLSKWLMVYHDWNNRGIYLTTSSDLLNWNFPRLIVRNSNSKGRIWYPNLVGEYSDSYSDSLLWLSYAVFDDNSIPERKYVVQKMIYVEDNMQNQVFIDKMLLIDSSYVTVKIYQPNGQIIETWYQDKFFLPGEYNFPWKDFNRKGLFILDVNVNNVRKSYKVLR